MKRILAATLAIALTGCATTQGTGSGYTPIVDQPNENYHRDLADCQQHANRVMSAGEGAAMGAAGGAILGMLFNAAAGGGFRNEYAAVGALSGALGGAASGERDQRTLISKCLAGRGHKILN